MMNEVSGAEEKAIEALSPNVVDAGTITAPITTTDAATRASQVKPISGNSKC